MVISAQDIDFQQSGQERLSCQYQGDPMSIGFQSSYLLEILKNIDSEQVVFELADPSRAGIILPFEGKEGEDDLLIHICQNLSASFFSSALLNWPTWKSCSMSLPSLLTKAPRGMAVKFSMVSNCFHSLLVI